jgi:hypothetical protein
MKENKMIHSFPMMTSVTSSLKKSTFHSVRFGAEKKQTSLPPYENKESSPIVTLSTPPDEKERMSLDLKNITNYSEVYASHNSSYSSIPISTRYEYQASVPSAPSINAIAVDDAINDIKRNALKSLGIPGAKIDKLITKLSNASQTILTAFTLPAKHMLVTVGADNKKKIYMSNKSNPNESFTSLQCHSNISGWNVIK